MIDRQVSRFCILACDQYKQENSRIIADYPKYARTHTSLTVTDNLANFIFPKNIFQTINLCELQPQKWLVIFVISVDL